MKNKNPLLVPELHEILAVGDSKTLRDFCESEHPAVIAELLSALTGEEVWTMLQHTYASLRSEIFSHLDEDLQVDILATLKSKEFKIAILLAVVIREYRFRTGNPAPAHGRPLILALDVPMLYRPLNHMPAGDDDVQDIGDILHGPHGAGHHRHGRMAFAFSNGWTEIDEWS